MLEVAAMLKENLRHLHKLSGTVLMPDFVTTIDKHIAGLWPELMRLDNKDHWDLRPADRNDANKV